MNIFQYAASEEMAFERMAAESGYKRISTFYSDLSIAEAFEVSGSEKGAIKDTFDRVCESWIGDFKMFTEFIMCLNWKIWKWYEKNEPIARIYNDLWRKAEDLFFEKWKENKDAIEYYYTTTD